MFENFLQRTKKHKLLKLLEITVNTHISQRKKILYPFSGKGLGGSHLSTATLIKHLNRKKFLPSILLHYDNDQQKKMLQKFKLPYEERFDFFIPDNLSDIILNPFLFVRSIQLAKRYLIDQDIDAVHLDNLPARYIWFYAALWAQIPYIHVQRTPVDLSIEKNILSIEKNISYRWMNAIISNSGYTQRSLPNLPGTIIQKIISPTIHLNQKEFDKKSNRDFVLSFFKNPGRTKKIIGFVANLQKRKKPETFIEAAAKLNEENQDQYLFLMVGKFYGESEKNLKQMASDLGLEHCFVFAGFQAEAQRIIDGLDILIAPSENEAFGRVIVEAMMLGTPVIASDDGGHQEIITNEQNGLLVPLNKPEEFVKAVRKVFENKKLQLKLIKNGLQRFKDFDAKTITKQFEEIYLSVFQKQLEKYK